MRWLWVHFASHRVRRSVLETPYSVRDQGSGAVCMWLPITVRSYLPGMLYSRDILGIL